VFTDVDCPWCRKFHTESVPELNKKGVEVRYLAYPRQGLQSEAFTKMVSAWCSADRNDAINKLKRGETIPPKSCNNPIAREYQLGQQIGVTGTPTIVLEDGELEPGFVSAGELAQRLGVGGRQLRRLFQKHLGTSPIAVAQTRRLLFAKKLVHETSMPMVEIACAAGFGSLRRFNDAFRRLYGRPPSELRRPSAKPRAARGARAARGGAITLSLSYVPPYDWEAIRRFFAARAIPGVEVASDSRYARTIELDGARGTIVVSPSTTKKNALTATIRFPVVSALPAIVARLRRMFDLDADVRMIHATLGQDALLAGLIGERPGLRVPGAWDPFELAVRAILGQQITVAAARGLAAKLVATYGHALDAEASAEGLTHVFPSARRLAKVDSARLGMPRARASALAACAWIVAKEPRLFDPTRSRDETLATLRALPGIGEWTAQYIALRALRDPDAFPASDIGILRGAAENGVRPTPAALLARAEAWRPWRAYAAQHLWCREQSLTRGEMSSVSAQRSGSRNHARPPCNVLSLKRPTETPCVLVREHSLSSS